MKCCEYCGANENETRIIKSKFGTLCRKHYLQMYRHGEIKRTIYDSNRYEIENDMVKIYMYNIKGEEEGYTIIDLEDLEKVKNYKIGKTTGGYARIQIGDKKMFLHNYLVDYDMVDHINRNKLDNRKSNLRPTNKSNNAENIDRGLYCGIMQVPSGKYQASIMVNYESIYLGSFNTKEEALFARYKAEIKYYGDNRVKDYDEEKIEIFKKNGFI